MAAYYNERDRYCVQWLKNLMRTGLIPNGDIDDRDIEHITPGDLVGYRQCHFFAGICGWPLALRWAQWNDDRPVWTGSCPCQPHSYAARGRHSVTDLWEPLRRLIAARRPRVFFGEQVTNARGWFDGVCDDMEVLGYAIGAAVLPACSVGKDHQRERLFFVGHANGEGESGGPFNDEMDRVRRYRGEPRGVELPYGFSPRVAQLRAFGNAVVPAVAAEFIGAYMDICSLDALSPSARDAGSTDADPASSEGKTNHE